MFSQGDGVWRCLLVVVVMLLLRRAGCSFTANVANTTGTQVRSLYDIDDPKGRCLGEGTHTSTIQVYIVLWMSMW